MVSIPGSRDIAAVTIDDLCNTVSDGLLNANDPLLVVSPVLFGVREVLGGHRAAGNENNFRRRRD